MSVGGRLERTRVESRRGDHSQGPPVVVSGDAERRRRHELHSHRRDGTEPRPAFADSSWQSPALGQGDRLRPVPLAARVTQASGGERGRVGREGGEDGPGQGTVGVPDDR